LQKLTCRKTPLCSFCVSCYVQQGVFGSLHNKPGYSLSHILEETTNKAKLQLLLCSPILQQLKRKLFPM